MASHGTLLAVVAGSRINDYGKDDTSLYIYDIVNDDTGEVLLQKTIRLASITVLFDSFRCPNIDNGHVSVWGDRVAVRTSSWPTTTSREEYYISIYHRNEGGSNNFGLEGGERLVYPDRVCGLALNENSLVTSVTDYGSETYYSYSFHSFDSTRRSWIGTQVVVRPAWIGSFASLGSDNYVTYHSPIAPFTDDEAHIRKGPPDHSWDDVQQTLPIQVTGSIYGDMKVRSSEDSSVLAMRHGGFLIIFEKNETRGDYNEVTRWKRSGGGSFGQVLVSNNRICLLATNQNMEQSEHNATFSVHDRAGDGTWDEAGAYVTADYRISSGVLLDNGVLMVGYSAPSGEFGIADVAMIEAWSNAPTPAPSSAPSPSPSLSMGPSTNPTQLPTVHPSSMPSNGPSTIQPTNNHVPSRQPFQLSMPSSSPPTVVVTVPPSEDLTSSTGPTTDPPLPAATPATTSSSCRDCCVRAPGFLLTVILLSWFH